MRTLFFHICADVLRHASCIGKVMVRAVVGANWGDEGKGKITDMLLKHLILLSDFRAEVMQVIPL